jgi:CelD/BcsL family acetyltransferase involved in cellulose biosynthesis
VAERTQSRVIPIAGVTKRDVAAWRDLAAASAEPNAFFEPEFVLPAVARLADAGGAELVAVEEADGWTACVPVRRTRWQGALPAAVALRTSYTYLSTPLVRAGDTGTNVEALDRAVRELSAVFVIERYRADGPIGAAIAQLATRGRRIEALTRTHERALLCRRESGDYHGWMSKKHERDLRRRRRKLEELAGEAAVEDVSDDPEAAKAFLDLEASGWKGREQTALASVPGGAEFFIAMCDGFRSQGRLEMLTLRTGTRNLAMLCNLRSGEGSYSFKIAHDEEFAKQSPGIQLEMANAEFFHASGSAWMDSCAEPDNAMINRLWPDRREIRTSVLAPAGPRGRILRAGLGAAEKLRERRRS